MKRLAPFAFVLACASLFLFPRVFAVFFALVAAPFIPAAPLAVGVLADSIYLSPGLHALPLATAFGALASLAAYAVRSRLSASIMA